MELYMLNFNPDYYGKLLLLFFDMMIKANYKQYYTETRINNTIILLLYVSFINLEI